MEETARSSRLVHFGVFELDLLAGELRKSGTKLKFSGQPFQVLAILLERPGDVVTREELQKRLWADGTFVDFDHNLNAAINKIREVLGDSAGSPRFVETLPRRGYRFIGSVEPVAPVYERRSAATISAGSAEPSSAAGTGGLAAAAVVSKPRRPRWKGWAVAVGGLGLVVIALLIYFQSRPLPPPKVSGYVPVTHDGNQKSLVGTDGARLYFNDNASAGWGIAQVSGSGGEVARVPVPAPSMSLLAVSPDGARLLIADAGGSAGG